VNIPGHIVQLETQINKLEKGQQNNENKTKLERLKEMLSKEKKNRIFNLEPEQFSPEVNVKNHHTSTRKQKLCCKMYNSYMERAMRKEKEILEKRRIAMSQIIW
jgi:hypothetical protein